MKLKFAAGLVLMCGISASAGAASTTSGLNVGGLLTPGVNLIDIYGVVVNPILQPVLAITSSGADVLVPSAHPLFALLGEFAPFANPVFSLLGTLASPASLLPALPGLPVLSQ
jgi:hypothetical protein